MSPRPADTTSGAGGRPADRASQMAPININWGPDLTEKDGDDVDEYGGGGLVYPKNGSGLTDPAG
jgi:hypothetical protein